MTDFRPFDVMDWFWFIGGDETRVWSSRAARYYQVSNAGYRDWLKGAASPTRILSEQELQDVLGGYGMPGPLSQTPDVLWGALRAERDRRLDVSDWTQLSDTPIDQPAWAAYRQALRDLPANTADPANPVWPSPPTDAGVVA